MSTVVDIVKSWARKEGCVTSTQEIIDWVACRNQTVKVEINQVEFEKEGFWFYDQTEGAIVNKKRSFFTITGLQTYVGDRVVEEQPIILQEEMGYLGILCKKIEGVLHFLIQAKIEPGNINKTQISPTIQATKSNFTRAHGGAQPAYLEYFTHASEYHIIVDQIQSEQSSRFYKKRNRNIIVEVDESEEVEVLPSHKWVTLGQLKELMRYDNLVNMDTRTVLSCIPFAMEVVTEEEKKEMQSYFKDQALFASIFERKENRLPSIYQQINNYKMFQNKQSRFIPLHKLTTWCMEPKQIRCKTGYHFEVIYCDIAIEGREVKQWKQPLFKAEGRATFGLFTRVKNGRREFLVHCMPEIGCHDAIEIGPTLQLEPGYHSETLDEVQTMFIEKYQGKEGIVKDVILSEEGGRFYHEENYNIIIEISEAEQCLISEDYFWVDYATLNILGQINNCLNIQVRNLLSLLDI